VTHDISVCIANYNGVGVVERCIESVLQQRPGASLEVIVYDDASSDDSVQRIRARFPHVQLITGEENVGYCAANNRMAQAATGRFLLLFNNDAFLPPGAIEQLYAAAMSEPRQILTLRQLHADSGDIIDYGMGMDYFFVPYPLKKEDPDQVITAIGACLWIPRDLFHKLGGFPEWFGSIAEDLYLCLRARIAGVKTTVLSSSSYYHHAGHSFGGSAPGRETTTTFNRRYLSERNRFWIMLIFVPGILLPFAAMAWLAIWILECAVLCLGSLSIAPLTRIYLPAFTGTVGNVRRIGESRKETQASRLVSWGWFYAPVRTLPTKLAFLLKRGLPTLN
jgi:GT2 family glycosyltransferase